MMRGKSEKKRDGIVLMSLGLLLLIAALLLMGYNIQEEERAGENANQKITFIQKKIENSEWDEEIPLYEQHPDMEMPVVEIEGNLYIGTLEIPVLELSLPIMENWDYDKLKISPCRYLGSVYQGDLILAAHNYKTHFGRLKDLMLGDQLKFTDIDGNEFLYEVVEMDILEKTAVEEMEAGDWELTLFTCTPGGSARVTVRCAEIEQ